MLASLNAWSMIVVLSIIQNNIVQYNIVNGFTTSNIVVSSSFGKNSKSEVVSVKKHALCSSSKVNNNEGEDSSSKKETPLDKAIKKAKAKAEIKRLTTGPDGITDIEGELKKVTSMGKGMAQESKESVEIEERVSNIEGNMYRAVEAGEFTIAAEKRDELNRMHIDDCGLVLQANSAFYRAFSDKDLIAMQNTWLHNDCVEFIQPDDGSPIRGYTKVQEWFKELFDLEDNLAVRLNTIQPAHVRMNVKGTTAWVSCDEEIYAPKFVQGLGPTRKLVGKLTATNLFRKVDGRWLMVHHHATWLSKEYDHQDPKSCKANPALRLMGNFNTQSSTSPKSGPVKKVVMGSLSDILNGGLGNFLSDGNGSSNKQDNGEYKTIIHLSSPLDDDDEDEEDDDDDSLLSKWAKLGGSSNSNSKAIVPSSLIKNNNESSSSENNDDDDDPSSLRQGCIQTLRKLCAHGSISQNQKRLLLTDIISCSTKGQNSMVEVAFDLLLLTPTSDKNKEFDEGGEEEFADQCRVLADSLFEK